MKQRTKIYYSAEQKALMWDRWAKGDRLHAIARLFEREGRFSILSFSAIGTKLILKSLHVVTFTSE